MLGVFSRLAPLLLLATSDFAAAARQNNKTANTISIGVLDIGMPTLSDQFAFGVRMATAQVNKNTSMLPDTTLTTQRVFVPQANVNPALLYDTVVTLCDSGQVIALASLTDGDTVKATSLVCPNLPHYSPIGGSAELSNKQLYPLFYRTTETIAQDLQVFVAHFKYFGWTRGAVITQSHWKFAAALSFEVFGSQGINLLASLNIADYDPTISQYYCPQIKSDFEFLRSTRLRIFVMFADQSNLIDYMMAANLTGLVGRNYVWHSFNSAGFDPTAQDRLPIPLDPSLLAAINVPWIVPEDSIDGTYYAYWNTLMVSYLNWVIANEAYLYPGMNLNQTDPTMPDYPLNYFYDDPGANYVPDWLLRGGYDAATSLAYTLEKLVTDLGTTGAALANSSLIPQVTLARVLEPYPRLPTAGGANKFVSNGDPYFARYGLYQLHGQSIAQLVYLAATYTLTSANGSGVFYVMPESYIWAGGRNLTDPPIDFPLTPEEVVDAQGRFAVAMYIIHAFLAAVALAAALFLVVCWEWPSLRVMQPHLLASACVGVAVSQAHIVSLVGKSRQFGCAVKPWLLPLGLIVTLSSLIVRCLRLLRVFSFIIGLKFLPLDKLKENHFVIAQTVNILIGTIPLIVISAAAPMRIQAVYFDDLDINRWECVGSTLTGTLYTVETVWIGFQFLLLFVFVFLIRSIPPALNDTRQVGGTAAILVMLCGICLLQVSNQQSITTRTMIESVIVAFGGAVVLFMFIVPLIVNVGMGTDMATRFAKRAAQINARVAKHRGSGSRTNNTGRTSKRDSTHRSGGGSGTDSGRHAGAIDTTSSSESETVARSINVETEVMSEQVLMELKSMKSLSDKNVFVLDSSQKLTQWRRASILLLGDPVFRLRIHISAKYEASLGCSRQAPEYIGLGALTHISIGEGMGPASNQMCVLVFTRRRVTVMFKDQNKAQAWVTAISQTTMKICGDNRKLSPSEGVRKMSISWKN